MNTVWILGDQLSLENSALASTAPEKSIVLMVESKAHGSLLKYHQVKLALVYSAMRHFSRDLRERGWTVDYYELEERLTFETAARRHVDKHHPEGFILAEPNSFFETEALDKLGRKLRIPVEFMPTAQFMVPRSDFAKWASGQNRIFMENHYRRLRKQSGLLMNPDGSPVGGAWNFDPENRGTFSSWKKAGRPRAKSEPREKPDAITREVIATVEKEFPHNPGQASAMWLPVDRAGALVWLGRFIQERLPSFGIYEDMMSEGEPFLFHSILSPLLNLGLLNPRECVEAAVSAYEKGAAPLNSVEGFIRQIIGWREFINGVYWVRGPEYKDLNALAAEHPLPPWLYTGETRMNCLHHVIRQTLDLGWNHHIQRLMILGNFFLIAGIRPQEALRWFLEMYVDAFDWVMAANVIGMSLYADGGYMATKPYAASSSYIRKMSNYCAGCSFDPDKKNGAQACPFNFLYWNFIDRHAAKFVKNPRMRAMIQNWTNRSAQEQDEVRASARQFLDTLDN